MHKVITAVVCIVLIAKLSIAQQKLFDQPMILKSCNIKIDANPFTATTFMELEFYNPGPVEIEGYHRFDFNPGQVITGLQLDLHGKYRDGSIEERRKANNAYRTIVGKRIDPAIIQWIGGNSYSLHVYPIPAKSSRKVTITILQMLKHNDGKLIYSLPLNFNKVSDFFRLQINTIDLPDRPIGEKLIATRRFVYNKNGSELHFATTGITLNQEIYFTSQLAKDKAIVSVSGIPGMYNYLMRLEPDNTKIVNHQNKKLLVYWDASGSSSSRNINKEISFLEKYIVMNNISEVEVIVFNEKVVSETKFRLVQHTIAGIRTLLLSVQNSGATSFSALNFSNKKADAALVFSDGINTSGKAAVVHGPLPIYCIVTGLDNDMQQLKRIVGTSGGAVLNLQSASVDSMIKKVNDVESYLMDITVFNGTMWNNIKFPAKLDKPMFLSGNMNVSAPITLHFGNSRIIHKHLETSRPHISSSDELIHKQVSLLMKHDSVQQYGSWEQSINFGLKEKVITHHTALLVLERIEDYITYNIAPPKELEAECAKRGFIYQSPYLKEIKKKDKNPYLSYIAQDYNNRIRWWGQKKNKIELAAGGITNGVNSLSSTGPSATVNSINNSGVNDIQEVVITSAFQSRRLVRSQTSSVQNISFDQLNTVRATDLNNALAGKVAGMQVRSQSGVALGRESTIRLRGENGLGSGNGPIYVVDGIIFSQASDIAMDDVEDITVLQGPAAAAMFGREGSNGAIVITMKKGKKRNYYRLWDEYKLSDLQDEDYLVRFKNIDKEKLYKEYTRTALGYKNNASFHFDMAQHFFVRGLQTEAAEILKNGIELCKGQQRGMVAAAYIYETWKNFDEAINVYQNILYDNPDDKVIMRNLALAYLQSKQYQKAIDTYNGIITQYTYHGVEEQALNEMNAIISVYRTQLDLTNIDTLLIRYMPVDLQISVQSNDNSVNYFHMNDPGGFLFGSYQTVSSNYFHKFYRGAFYDLSVLHAYKGSYPIHVSLYKTQAAEEPLYARIITFKNFHRFNQMLEIQTIQLNNQYGNVEVGEVSW